MKTKDAVQAKSNAKEVVADCIKALNAEDFDAARDYMSDDMQFVGVLGSRDGAAAYIEDMKKMKLKYHVKKTFVNGDDVCLIYDLDMSGTTIFGCGWYHVEDSKINSLKVIFDPRAILEQQAKKQ